MGSKAKKYAPEVHFSGERGSGSSLKPHSLIFRPILRKSAIVIFRQQFKTFDSNNFTLSPMLSF